MKKTQKNVVFNTEGWTKEEERCVADAVKESERGTDIVLVVCPSEHSSVLGKFVMECWEKIRPNEENHLLFVSGDLPQSALAERFQVSDVTWIVFAAAPARVGEALHQIKVMWGDNVFYSVVRSIGVQDAVQFTNVKSPVDSLTVPLKKEKSKK